MQDESIKMDWTWQNLDILNSAVLTYIVQKSKEQVTRKKKKKDILTPQFSVNWGHTVFASS